MLVKLNDTSIVLIPKKKIGSAVEDLRPISLCKVKVIIKVVAKCLKELLDNMVSNTQTAFVAGRLIKDNIMVSYELMHFLKRK